MNLTRSFADGLDVHYISGSQSSRTRAYRGMKKAWRPRAREDYERWRRTDPKILKLVNALVGDIERSPYEGLAGQESFNLSGKAGGFARYLEGTASSIAFVRRMGFWKLHGAVIITGKRRRSDRPPAFG